MNRHPYNLATRPFRNETLPALLLAAGWLLLLLGSAVHVLAVRALGPESTGALHREVGQLEDRRVRLEGRAQRFQRDVPPAELEAWSFVKSLVDRRAFSWTRLLFDLEQALPAGARVTMLSPEVRDGRLLISLEARVRAPEDGLDLVRRLEERAEFGEVSPLSVADQPDGRHMRLRMYYTPPQPPAPDAARSTSPAPPPDPEDEE